MKIFEIEIVSIGDDDKLEICVERIIAGTWQEVHEMLARICRDTGRVISSMKIIQTGDAPFDNKTRKIRLTGVSGGV